MESSRNGEPAHVYLNFAETCERLRLSPETLRRLIKSGLIEAHKITPGRTAPYRISEAAVADYLRRQTDLASA